MANNDETVDETVKVDEAVEDENNNETEIVEEDDSTDEEVKDVDDMTLEEQVEHYKSQFEFWKKQSRKNEQKFKVFKDAAEKWENYEANDLPVFEQLKEDYENVQKELGSVKRKNLVNKYLIENGLNANVAKFVTGETEEEISESVNDLIETFGVKEKSVLPNPLQGGNNEEPIEENISAFQRDLKANLRR